VSTPPVPSRPLAPRDQTVAERCAIPTAAERDAIAAALWVTGAEPERDLTEAELAELVDDLAAHPERWAHHVEHDPDRRHYTLLRRDDHVAVWLICWMDDHDTGFHDHDVSAGAVAVVAGAVREERLVLGGGTVDRVSRAGESFTFAASDIHRVRHAGTQPAVTIHAYSPPLWRMGAYEVAATGELRRHSVSYAEELRPLAPA
jgi:predicted metal-dependent enzyme (double-stranded beta helix superfamily)